MANTPKLEFPEISASQSQKEVTHNEALKMLDFMVQPSVIDKDLTSPPGGESEGDCYIVGDPSSGDWEGEENNIAQYYNGVWVFYTPNEGWMVWVEDEDVFYIYSGNIYDGFNWEALGESGTIERNADITLYPEYSGAVLSADGGDNDPGIEGMTSDSEVVSNVRHNYYEWSSDEATLQDYDVVVQIPIPFDFSGFQVGANVALTLDIKTEEDDDANNKLDITINRDGQAATSSLTGQYSASAATWEVIGFDETDDVLAAVPAGETLNVAIKLYSQNSKYTRIGKINLAVKIE